MTDRSVRPAPSFSRIDQMNHIDQELGVFQVAQAPAPHREWRIFCLFRAVVNLAVAYQAYVEAQLDEALPIGRLR